MSHSARAAAAVAAVAAAAGLAVLLAGCSDDEPRPRMSPTPSASPTLADTPTLDPTPTVTSAVRTAVATVRAWIAGQNVALRTGDTAAVEQLSAPSCESCEQLIAPIRNVYQAGGRFETKGWIVESARKRDRSARPEEVDVAVTISAGRTFLSASGDPVAYDEDKRILRFTLMDQSGGRVVAFVGFLS